MNNEQIVNNLKSIMTMEWYGIRIEDTKEVGIATHQYVSVPESSTIEIEDQELNDKIKTADGLKLVAKDMLIKMMLDLCRATYDEDDIEEFMEDIKRDISDYLTVYARVRKGEVWTREMGDARVAELTEELKAASGYQEV